MRASDILIGKIKEFEGCRLYAYRDSGGKPTIGYGHTKNVRMGMACTKAQAEAWLREDLAVAESFCNAVSQIDTQGKFDACVDFCFNLGTGNFKGSTLFKKIRAKAPTSEIQAQFRRWVYSDGKKQDGLVRRREWDARRWAE